MIPKCQDFWTDPHRIFPQSFTEKRHRATSPHPCPQVHMTFLSWVKSICDASLMHRARADPGGWNRLLDTPHFEITPHIRKIWEVSSKLTYFGDQTMNSHLSPFTKVTPFENSRICPGTGYDCLCLCSYSAHGHLVYAGNSAPSAIKVYISILRRRCENVTSVFV